MNIFKLITSNLASKEFEDEKLYFDKNGNVCFIEHQNRVSYVFLRNGKYELATELLVGRTISCPLLKGIDSIFIIPGIETRDDTKLLEEGQKEYFFPASELPHSLFEVVNFGIAEDQIFKGCYLSRSIIKVAVQNPTGRTFEISMTLADGVRSCDGNPHGEIKNAYKLVSACTISGDVIKITI